MARFNFVIDDDAGLEKVAEDTGRKTKAEVVRDALSFYQYVLRRLEAGDRLFMGTEKEKITEIAVTTFDRLQREAARKRAEQPVAQQTS